MYKCEVAVTDTVSGKPLLPKYVVVTATFSEARLYQLIISELNPDAVILAHRPSLKQMTAEELRSLLTFGGKKHPDIIVVCYCYEDTPYERPIYQPLVRDDWVHQHKSNLSYITFY